MEIGNILTYTRRTFKFGNSQAVSVPASLGIPNKAMLKVTIELIDLGEKEPQKSEIV